MKDKKEEGQKASQQRASRWFLLLLLSVSLYLAFYLLRIYIHPLILAILLASIFSPIHQRIGWLLKGKRNLSAFISCLLVTLLIVLPLLFLSIGLVDQGIGSVNAVRRWFEQGNLENILRSEHLAHFRQSADRYLAFFDLEISRLQDWMVIGSQHAGQFLLSKGGVLVSNLGTLILHFWIMIFVLFYLLRDGKKWLDRFLHLFPLTKDQEILLIDRIRLTGRSAMIGSFLTAAAQGIVGGLGLWISGIPPLFWGSLMAVASIIPLVGTSLVWLPAVLYLFMVQKTGRAIFLMIYSLTILGSIDNFLRPFLMPKQKGVSMHPLLVFLAILGGIQVFGLIGVIYGPMIFSLLSSLLYLYEAEFASFLKRQDRP